MTAFWYCNCQRPREKVVSMSDHMALEAKVKHWRDRALAAEDRLHAATSHETEGQR